MNVRIKLPQKPKVGQRLSHQGVDFHKPLQYVAERDGILVTYIEGGTVYLDRRTGNVYEPAKYILFMEAEMIDPSKDGYSSYEIFIEFPASIKRYFE